MTEESLRMFTIKYVYNDKTRKSLAEMRWRRWNRMKKKNFARTGIDEDSHSNRCKRVIFAVASIEYFEQASEFGDPLLNGYVVNERMQCVPVRYCKDALPAEIRGTVIAPELEAPGNDE